MDDIGKHVNNINKAWLCTTIITYPICACNIKCENDSSSVVSECLSVCTQFRVQLKLFWHGFEKKKASRLMLFNLKLERL